MAYILNVSLRAATASTTQEYARTLSTGDQQFREVSEARWRPALFEKYGGPPRAGTPHRQWLASRDELVEVNGELIGLTRSESVKLDPHQYWIVREVERCFTEIGLSPYNLGALRVAVSAGAMANEFVWQSVDEAMDHAPSPLMTLGQYDALLANRISNHFGFTGISRTINAACASSGVALLDALNLLKTDAADIVVVAACNINLHPRKYASFHAAGMLTRSGACRPFDSRADGYVPCDAVAVALVVNDRALQKLGRMPQAEILGGAQNHNGNRSQSLTAPSVVAQQELLQTALENSRVNPLQVGLIEAHATGTSLGDPIEVEALAHVYGNSKSVVGSHKGIFGHAEAAAGLLGLAKLVHVFASKSVPGNRWIREFNPLIERARRELLFPVENLTLNTSQRAIAGLSCFGFGGVNTHLLIAEPSTRVVEKRSLHTFLHRNSQVSLHASNSKSEILKALDTKNRITQDTSPATTESNAPALPLNHRFRVVALDATRDCVDKDVSDSLVFEQAMPIFALDTAQIESLKIIGHALASPFAIILPDGLKVSDIEAADQWLPVGSYLIERSGNYRSNRTVDVEEIVRQLGTFCITPGQVC